VGVTGSFRANGKVNANVSVEVNGSGPHLSEGPTWRCRGLGSAASGQDGGEPGAFRRAVAQPPTVLHLHPHDG
jgi:hypothetical protein